MTSQNLGFVDKIQHADTWCSLVQRARVSLGVYSGGGR